ncbi:MAG: hypothetical protein M3N98_05630, partial [Actinomycetota bacterium]|nr:hypothetical protein [Actinomycetota bacterium]
GGAGAGAGAGGANAVSMWRRRKWLFLCALAVLGALAVGLVGRAMRPKTVEPRVLTDAAFIRAANADCTATLPTLRPADGGPLGSAMNANQAADQIETAANGMDGLIGRLAVLPAADADRPHIAGWLDDWHRYTVTGHDYATFLRQHGANQKNPPAMLNTAAQLGRKIDDFARANGLSRCLLAFVYTASPSDF